LMYAARLYRAAGQSWTLIFSLTSSALLNKKKQICSSY
jgi:hypothetical protein